MKRKRNKLDQNVFPFLLFGFKAQKEKREKHDDNNENLFCALLYIAGDREKGSENTATENI